MNAKEAREITIKCSEQQRKELQLRAREILAEAQKEIEKAAGKGFCATTLTNCFLIGTFPCQQLSEMVMEKLKEDGFICCLMEGNNSLGITW